MTILCRVVGGREWGSEESFCLIAGAYGSSVKTEQIFTLSSAHLAESVRLRKMKTSENTSANNGRLIEGRMTTYILTLMRFTPRCLPFKRGACGRQ